MKDWYQYRTRNLTHRDQLGDSRYMTYRTMALQPNSCGPMADGLITGLQGSILSTPQLLDPSIKDLYQYRSWNITHRALFRDYRQMTHYTTALLPNSCGPMGDCTFGDPIGMSYPHPKYWTNWWRIDINIGHEISRTESSSENQGTWHIVRRHYYQMAAAQWRMVHLGTPRVGPINNPNIGPIDEGLISISGKESHP